MRRLTTALLLTTLALVSCGVPEPAHEGALQADLAPALLTADEVRDAPGAPGGLTIAGGDRIDITQDPDPRGPCGAVVDAVPFDAGAVAVFGRPDVILVHLVLVDTADLAERVIDQHRSDLRPGCAPYAKTAQSGGTQQTELIREVALPDLGDESVAFLVRGVVGDAAPVYGLQTLIRRGTDLVALVLFTSEPLEDDFIRELAVTATRRLEALR